MTTGVTGVCIYRDGPCFPLLAKRIETLLIPRLQAREGFRFASMLRFYEAHNGAAAGMGILSFRTSEQLTAAMVEATSWSHRHLPDLEPMLGSTDLMPCQVMFARGSLG